VTDSSTIRAARMARGSGVRELARRMNVTPGAVSQWERSEANHTIQPNTLNRALEALRETSPSTPGPESESAPFERRDERVAFELHRAIAKRLLDAPEAVRAAISPGVTLIGPNVRGPLAEAWLDESLALSTGSKRSHGRRSEAIPARGGDHCRDRGPPPRQRLHHRQSVDLGQL
jgi:transcriptional regulator with XRE-family HTH domain